MNREDARKYIVENARDYLETDRSGKGFICPICGSGSGKNGTGITTKDNIHFTCWTGCFSHSDIIDIIGLENGLVDYNDKLEAAASAFRISIDNDFVPNTAQYQKQAKNEQSAEHSTHNSSYTTTQPEKTDYVDFFLQANEHIEETDYHRGLSLETLNKFKVGYVPEWRLPLQEYLKGGNGLTKNGKPRTKESWEYIPTSPRLIIPTSRYSYLARDTRTGLPPEQQQYTKQKVGAVQIFNAKALYEAKKPIFVVEGEIDALSIIEVGCDAVALGSTANVKLLRKRLEEKVPVQPLLLAMDNDCGGDDALAKLKEALTELNVPYWVVSITDGYKDANEALVKDREAFTKAVNSTVSLVIGKQEEANEVRREVLRRDAAANCLEDFEKDVEANRSATCYSTGIQTVDCLLDGGLYAGLYTIGAISSLGKTTLAIQIADNIAAAGTDVIIFSLEMARNEIIAKSLSRLTFTESLHYRKFSSFEYTKALSKSTRDILKGTIYENFEGDDKYVQTYKEDQEEVIRLAKEAYKKFAGHIYIKEGIGNIGVEEIRETVRNHTEIMGKPPVILIDYLQILAPAEIRATDKQNTDKAVLELKRLSRDYNIPVIGISSFNRENYTAPVNLASYKESGAIEYSSDVLIGIQYSGMDYQSGESEKARDQRIRDLTKCNIESAKHGNWQEMDFKVLKNRNGSKGSTELYFFPRFNFFDMCLPHEATGASKTEDNAGWTTAISNYK